VGGLWGMGVVGSGTSGVALLASGVAQASSARHRDAARCTASPPRSVQARGTPRLNTKQAALACVTLSRGASVAIVAPAVGAADGVARASGAAAASMTDVRAAGNHSVARGRGNDIQAAVVISTLDRANQQINRVWEWYNRVFVGRQSRSSSRSLRALDQLRATRSARAQVGCTTAERRDSTLSPPTDGQNEAHELEPVRAACGQTACVRADSMARTN
jgi:hypothetical protein